MWEGNFIKRQQNRAVKGSSGHENLSPNSWMFIIGNHWRKHRSKSNIYTNYHWKTRKLHWKTNPLEKPENTDINRFLSTSQKFEVGFYPQVRK
jgi:hypothetical protein